MKKTTITMLCLAACFAAADTKVTWLADVTADRAETVTGAQSNQIAAAAAHIVRTDNPHSVTAAQIGALTNELDLAALRTFHYGSPDIVESPAEWFVFDGAGTITAFNWAAGRENVVIPWAIGGVPVTVIGGNAFASSGIVSLIAPQTVTSIEDNAFADCSSLDSISLPQVQMVGNNAFYFCSSLSSVTLPQVQMVGNNAFYFCSSLASISLPQVQTVGNNAFADCSSLASVSLPQVLTVGAGAFGYCTSLSSVYFDHDAPTIGADIFSGITPNQVTIYVTNQTATGWGATFAGMPVVRLPLYADAIYQAGELVATTGYVAQASLADADGYTTQMVMRVGSEITTNRWGPRLTLPDGIVTNGMGGMLLATNAAGARYVRMTGDGGGWGSALEIDGNLWLSNLGKAKIRFPGGGYVTEGVFYAVFIEMGFKTWLNGAERWVIRSLDGHAYIDNGNLTVAGTNTAAEVRSLGGYSIFDSGSNCYWRVTASNGTFYASDTNGVRKFKFTTETP